MANPQKENGYTPIANEILDAVLMRRWTKTQQKVLMIIWRFSYGFSKKKAWFGFMQDMCAYDLARAKIGRVLTELEDMNVLLVDRDLGEITFNKDYLSWSTPTVRDMGSSLEIHAKNIRVNLNRKHLPKNGWSKMVRGGGRKADPIGRYEDIVEKLIFGKQDIATLYSHYLSTRHWRFLRKKKLEECGSRCQHCKTHDDVKVHHKTYDTLGRESLDDLIALCQRCHSGAHVKELLSPCDAIDLLRVNHHRSTELPKSKSNSCRKVNQTVAEKVINSARKPNDGAASGTSESKVKKEKTKSSCINVNIVSEEEAENFGMHLRTIWTPCCNPNIPKHMEVLQAITPDKQQRAIELTKQAMNEEVYHWEFMAWLNKKLGEVS